jgi:hypothetical protein
MSSNDGNKQVLSPRQVIEKDDIDERTLKEILQKPIQDEELHHCFKDMVEHRVFTEIQEKLLTPLVQRAFLQACVELFLKDEADQKVYHDAAVARAARLEQKDNTLNPKPGTFTWAFGYPYGSSEVARRPLSNVVMLMFEKFIELRFPNPEQNPLPLIPWRDEYYEEGPAKLRIAKREAIRREQEGEERVLPMLSGLEL